MNKPKTAKMTYRPFGRLSGFAAVVILLLCATAASIQAQSISYSGSLQFATGKYIFNERTSSYYLYNGFIVTTGRLSISTSIPLIVQNTPWISSSGAGLVPSGGTQHSEVGKATHRDRLALLDTTQYDQVGIGDPTIYVSLRLWEERSGLPSFSATANAKLPLSSADKGFGTGKWDYGFGASLAKSFQSTFVFLDASYWILGDLPDFNLVDPFFYSVALGRNLGGGDWGLLAFFSGSSRTIETVDPPLQMGLGLNRLFDPGNSLTGNVSFGLTQSAPDFAASLGWRTRL